jgi:acetyltransferase-like isoleucine patch superfamily enzyme
MAGDGNVNPKTCSVVVGRGSLLLCHVYFERDGASLTVGDNTFIGSSELVISTGITIGDNVLISNGCMIQDHDSHPSETDLRRLDLPALLEGRRKDWSRVKCQQITIEDNVWIGARAIVLKGVIVGTGSIIGAGAVVTRKVAPSSTVVGNPAREI